MFLLQIHKLEEEIQTLEKEREESIKKNEERECEQDLEREEEKITRLEPLCKSEFERLNEELKNAQHTIWQMQVCIHTNIFKRERMPSVTKVGPIPLF